MFFFFWVSQHEGWWRKAQPRVLTQALILCGAGCEAIVTLTGVAPLGVDTTPILTDPRLGLTLVLICVDRTGIIRHFIERLSFSWFLLPSLSSSLPSSFPSSLLSLTLSISLQTGNLWAWLKTGSSGKTRKKIHQTLPFLCIPQSPDNLLPHPCPRLPVSDVSFQRWIMHKKVDTPTPHTVLVRHPWAYCWYT